MAAAADDQTALATDLAEILVQSGMPFRDAHAVVGALVRESLARAPSTLAEAGGGLTGTLTSIGLRHCSNPAPRWPAVRAPAVPGLTSVGGRSLDALAGTGSDDDRARLEPHSGDQ